MRSVIKSAKTVDEAVELAIKELGISREDANIEILEESKSGFLGLFGSKDAIVKVVEKKYQNFDANNKEDVKIELGEKETDTQDLLDSKDEKYVDLDEDNKTYNSTEESDETKSHTDDSNMEYVEEIQISDDKVKTIDQIALDLQKNLEDLLKSMHIKASVKTSLEGENITYTLEDISEEDTGIIIGRKGETLDSVQYILSLIANKDSQQFYRINLDVAKYRERRKSSIENNARKTAFKVLKTKKSISLEPMNSYERRIVHYALQDYKELETISQGNYPNRKVVIKYKG